VNAVAGFPSLHRGYTQGRSILTLAEAKRLARMLRSPLTRSELTDDECKAIAADLIAHHRPAHAPLLEDRDPSATRAVRAQHYAAWLLMEWQRAYRQENNVPRVPGSVTAVYLDAARKYAATSKRIDQRQVSKDAVLRIVKNNRVALRDTQRWRPPPTLRPTK
jgi:hypothetical protein